MTPGVGSLEGSVGWGHVTLDFVILHKGDRGEVVSTRPLTRTGSQEADVPAQRRGRRCCLDADGHVLGLKCRQCSGMQDPGQCGSLARPDGTSPSDRHLGHGSWGGGGT